MRPLRHFFLLHRRVVEAVEKLRVDLAHARDHLADHRARLGRRIRRRGHAPQPVQHDAGKRVHHRGRRRDGQHVARDFDRAFLRLPVHFLHALGVRHGADVPDVAENFASVALQQRSQLPVIAPGARNRVFVNRALGRAEPGHFRRQIGERVIQAHVPLALLLGVVERMRVQERPDELPADIFEAKFKVRVLVDGVVAAVKRGRADLQALLVGDFFRPDEARRVAGARRGDGRIVGMREVIAQRDARRSGFKRHAIRLRRSHRLSGHISRDILHCRAKYE